MSGPTPEEVLEFRAATNGFLCPLSANVYGLTFLSFVLKDYRTKEVIFEIGNQTEMPEVQLDENTTEDSLRTIRYEFSVDVLRKESISTLLVFQNGPEPVEDFRMVERHYFKGRLIKSYDFKFGFVIPNTTNTWESIYTLPAMEEDLIEEIVQNPYELKSDSFYFAGSKLIMHNKSEYSYVKRSGAASATIPPSVGTAESKLAEAEASDSKLDDDVDADAEAHAKLAAEAEVDIEEEKARLAEESGSKIDD